MCVKLAALGCGVRVEKWGAERDGSGGRCPGPGDRQVASGAGQSREGVSAACSRQVGGTLLWASPHQLVGGT